MEDKSTPHLQCWTAERQPAAGVWMARGRYQAHTTQSRMPRTTAPVTANIMRMHCVFIKQQRLLPFRCRPPPCPAAAWVTSP